MPTDRHTQAPQQALAGTPTQSAAYLYPNLSQAVGLLRVRCQDAGHALRKNLAHTPWGTAAPAAEPELELYARSLQWQIVELTPVTTVSRVRDHATTRTDGA